jgi:metal-responsive CopG/Arc/MetJ family transcriptional regulator
MINCAEMSRGIVVSARISPALLASVEEAAARLGLNRGQFVREAIQMAVRAENAAHRLLEAT